MSWTWGPNLLESNYNIVCIISSRTCFETELMLPLSPPSPLSAITYPVAASIRASFQLLEVVVGRTREDAGMTDF